MNDPEQLFNAVRTSSLSSEERSRIRTHIAGYMALHPRRSGVMAALGRHAFAYGFSALILLAGTTTALADRSSPGDLLYPVKVHVNNRVANIVTGTAHRKPRHEKIANPDSSREMETEASESAAFTPAGSPAPRRHDNTKPTPKPRGGDHGNRRDQENERDDGR